MIQDYILTDELIAEIAERVTLKFNSFIGQNELLDEFKKKRAENERAVNNILTAMEQGIITGSTKDRLLQLEKRKEELAHNIAVQSAIRREPMTVEEITEYLYSFKGLDYALEQNKKRLRHLFIRKVILYNDKCLIYFNFTDRAEALLTLDESLESERTASTTVGDGSLAIANTENKPKHNPVFEFVTFGAPKTDGRKDTKLSAVFLILLSIIINNSR